uniref:Uncharacterized protein n=1 Tax=Arundo donax TaxID=35708 RepID=A0A0A9QVN6_ARUDO
MTEPEAEAALGSWEAARR